MDNKAALKYLTEKGVYLPAVVPGRGVGGFFIFSSLLEIGRGETIDAAIADARRRDEIPNYPAQPPYYAERLEVMRSGASVAVAKSGTMAQRIANALNLYNPDARGK
jgi:outer membrane receptor protein involved in Fe transport